MSETSHLGLSWVTAPPSFLLPRERTGSSVQREGCGEGGRSQRQPCLDALEEMSLICREEWQDYKLKRKSIWNSQLIFWIASDMPIRISVTKLSPLEMPFISSLLDLSFTLLKGQLSIIKPSSHHTVPWMNGHCAVPLFPPMHTGGNSGTAHCPMDEWPLRCSTVPTRVHGCVWVESFIKLVWKPCLTLGVCKYFYFVFLL